MPLPIYGKGKNSREWLFVDDHCDALIKIFKKGKIGNFYNIGSNYNLNNISVVKKILSKMKNKIRIGNNVKIKYVKDRPGHDLRYALNSKKIRKQLRWKHLYNFEISLKKTFEWYYNNYDFFKTFSNFFIFLQNSFET